MLMQIVKTVAALSISGAAFFKIILPVRVWKIPSARPQVMRIEINFPKMEKILIVIFGNLRRPMMIITEMSRAGERLRRTVSGEIPITIPETKQPRGIVHIPQRRPKSTSSWFSFFAD